MHQAAENNFKEVAEIRFRQLHITKVVWVRACDEDYRYHEDVTNVVRICILAEDTLAP